MITKRVFSLLNLLLVLALPINAANLGKGTVTGVFPRASAQETYVIYSNTVNSPCSDKNYLVLRKSSAMSDELFSTLLIAYTTKSPNVSILVEGCDSNNRAIIESVVLE